MEQHPINQPQPNTTRDWSWLAPILLVLILVLGAVLRLSGVNWDEDQHLHPDERFLTMVESALTIPGLDKPIGPLPQGCAKWGGYFNTECSPLNPYNHNFGLFVYGTFPIFLTRLIGEFLGQTGYGEIHLLGRVFSALFDLATVLLIFLIGRRMYGVRAALLGALFLAASVLDIQQSHFFTVDTFTNVPILLAFWCALDIADGKHWRAFVYAGAAFGLALAGRINIAPFAVVLIAAGALRAYRVARGERQGASDETRLGNDTALESAPESLNASSVAFEDVLLGKLARAFVGLVGAAIVALIVFRIFQPYAANGPNFIAPTLPKFETNRGAVNVLLDVVLSWAGGVNPKFADNMSYIGELVAGRQDYPPGHQWTNRTAYIFPFENMVLWGLGLPLGLVAWAGFAFALYRLIRYREWQHLLIVAWVGVTFGYTGQQWVKTLRYFLQIYPFLALLAGWFLVALWDKATNDERRTTNVRPPSFVLRPVVGLVALVVIGYTLFWAIAFATIYTRPVSRVTASRWIFENVPKGSILANEHWDDPLPLRIDGMDPFGGMYQSLPSAGGDGEMHWYDEDTPEKRAQAIKWIDEADYIILSSNRLYGSIPRLPMRYPLTKKYYEWLFDGTLGFDKVAEITSRPQLFGIEINDDNAEEAFTVYDHPKVLVFKKALRYSRAQVAALFDSVDLNEVYRFWPREATQAPTALLLTPPDRDAQARGGTWLQIFNPDDWINRVPVIVWLALIEILGWLAFPLAFVAFRALADRGYIFAKAIGVLLPAWGAWTLASYHLVPFSRASIALVIALVAIVSALAVWWRGREIVAFLRERWTIVLVEELLFLAFFGAFLLIRYGNPDLWHQWFGGEKPMDFAQLNAVIKSTWFPPYDPWFAGGYLDYYYFGQVINATLIKFSGIVPEVAYNLALPMYFALTAMGAFGVVFNLVAPRVIASGAKQSPSDVEIASQKTLARTKGRRALLAGLLGAIFVAVIGNLGQVILIGQTFLRIGGGDPKGSIANVVASLANGIWRVFVEHQPFDVPTGQWYWNASRIIVTGNAINEFPFFTFVYADLHAHLMALAFTLVVIGFCVNFVVRERDDDARLPFLARVPISPSDVIEVIAVSLVFGVLRAINIADFPTYLLLIGCALAIGEYARRRAIDWAGICAVAWRFGAVIVLSTLLYQPFIKNFVSAYLSIELWKGEHTGFAEYLIVHGIFLFAIVTFLFAQTFDTPERRKFFVDILPLVVVAFIVAETAFIFTDLMAFAIAFPLLALAAILVLRPELDARVRFVALLIAAGLAMTLMVEVIVTKGDIGRMNTVFKFYNQVWVFFAIAAAAGIALLRQTKDERRKTDDPSFVVRRSSSILSAMWWMVFGFLIFVGLLYPITATRAKVNDRYTMGSPAGLNGMDFMRTAVYQDRNYDEVLEYDRQAIEWLRANVEGSPVILEGNAPLYHWASRVSVYTGLPTVIGWDWHEKQQRSIIDGAIIDRRLDAVRQIYNSRSADEALALVKRFRVAYIYVGDLERAFYDQAGLAKFDAMARAGQLQLVYQNERVRIYKIVE